MQYAMFTRRAILLRVPRSIYSQLLLQEPRPFPRFFSSSASSPASSPPPADPSEPAPTSVPSSPSLASQFTPGPSPPRLPAEEQAEFERLQRQAQVSQLTRPIEDQPAAPIAEELHPNIRRGAPPEFEGNTNPKTGEVGGPKTDPLKWSGDWSYNGRVTDF